ncbi:MAG: hypothetical protein KY467_16175 [Gemmatimonadetes bacterium]|nr:hypothetical protein [Gemmatimonadota bacterium]
MKTGTFLMGLALVLLPGCTPAAEWREPRTAAPASSVITREEIQSVRAGNLYEVVQRLRPGWLSTRGIQNFSGRAGMIVVYQDHQRMGEVGALREIAPANVVGLRYLDATSAAMLPGIRPREIVGGAIVVVTPASGPAG